MSSPAARFSPTPQRAGLGEATSSKMPVKPAVSPTYPRLYQINTRVLLTSLSHELGRSATLEDVPDGMLDQLATDGFDWVWFLGVWQTGSAGRSVSLGNPEWQHEFRDLLPDFRDDDVCGSCFAIQSYTVHSDFGGNAALERLRQRVHDRGMRLLLDFVPNHMAPDHPWVQQYPDYFVHGTEALIDREPQNYTTVITPKRSGRLWPTAAILTSLGGRTLCS